MLEVRSIGSRVRGKGLVIYSYTIRQIISRCVVQAYGGGGEVRGGEC